MKKTVTINRQYLFVESSWSVQGPLDLREILPGELLYGTYIPAVGAIQLRNFDQVRSVNLCCRQQYIWP